MFPLKLSFALVILAVAAHTSSGLQCYVCDYQSGFPDPHNCQLSPADAALTEITDEYFESLVRGHSVGHPFNIFFKNSISKVSSARSDQTKGTNAEVWPYKFCGKINGTTYDGSEIVSRNAFASQYEGVLVPGCRTDSSTGVTMKFCLCSSDGCNKSNNDADYSS